MGSGAVERLSGALRSAKPRAGQLSPCHAACSRLLFSSGFVTPAASFLLRFSKAKSALYRAVIVPCAIAPPAPPASGAAPRKARPTARSSAASGATSPARSTGTYSAARSHRRPVPSHSTDREPRQRQWPKGLFDAQRGVNAVAETFVATRKKELIHRRSSPGREELRREVLDRIELFYDPVCRHRG